MTPERWQQVRELLQSAMQLEPAERLAYLEHHCSSDSSLRKDVDSLLAGEHELRASFLESPAIAHLTPDQNTAASVNWKPGMKLGPYEIQSLLGAGGMGEVYRARDTRLDRTVALKVLPLLLSSDPARKQRFEREARAIAALQHPNICTLHDVGQQQGVDYLVMEYLEGETLTARLTKGPLPLDQILRFGVEITDALDAAHRRGIVHRDLKPGNIFLTTHGECKVLDFGLAKLEEPHAAPETPATVTANQKILTTPGLVIGTVAYMSPEQARGEELDARSDIFSLGAVLFEMATGQLPFTGKTSAMTFKAILDETPVPPTQLNKALPQKVDEIVAKALEKDRELRYQSAAELRTDLKRLRRDTDSAGSPAAATGARPLELETHREGRRLRGFLLAGAILTVAVAILFGWYVPANRPQVESIAQITDDGLPKQVFTTLVGDGSRLYFNEARSGTWEIGQVSGAGGNTAEVGSRLASPNLLDLVPDSSALLVSTGTTFSVNPLWLLPIPAGEPRRVGELLTSGAAYFPDSQMIVLSKENSLYVARADGSDSHKLVDLPGDVSVTWPRVSPDGKLVRFTVASTDSEGRSSQALWEVRVDGTNLRPLRTNLNQPPAECCGRWTPDGRYFVFQSQPGLRSDIYAMRESHGLFVRSAGKPTKLTDGPYSYSLPLPSADGKRIFAIGSKLRGELVRYDANSQQFVPFLSGISAFDVAYSRDGKWVAYISYPDDTLWRMRVDGTDRRQLLFPPMGALLPQWSPDGKRIAYGGWNVNGVWMSLYIIDADGGTPQKISDNATCPFWSLDGNSLIFSDASGQGIRTIDLRTHRVTDLPDAEDKFGPSLSPDGKFILSTTTARDKLMLFDVKRQEWTKLTSLTSGRLNSWSWSKDSRYIYYADSNPSNPSAFRIGLVDRRVEPVASLKNVRTAFDPTTGFWADVTPDGSLLTMRETGLQEIYALNVRWP